MYIMPIIEVLRREAIYLWYYFTIQFDQIFQYWALGIFLGSVISVFGKRTIHQLFEALQKKKLGAFGVVPASILGIASPLCMYGTIPIAASFSEKGIKDDWLAAFMMSSILLNPQLILYSAALGPAALVVRVVSCFLCGITAGLVIRFFYSGKDKSFFTFNLDGGEPQSCEAPEGTSGFREPANRDTDPNMILRLLKNIWRNVKITGPYFLIGIALSAIFQRYVPEEAFAKLFGSNRGFGLLMAATVGVPLYVCGGGTIPLLQTWIHNGMSMGQAASFMISGPAMKITNLGALKIVLGIKHFALYLLFSVVFALLSGLVVDVLFLIPR